MTIPNFDSVSDEQPWPQMGDRLFTSGDDWWHNACLNYGSDNWELYILGYKKAGDALVNHVSESSRGQDYFVFPIVFVYRQYLELRVKKLVRDCQELFGEPTRSLRTHDLTILWHECRPLLEKLDPKVEVKDLDAVEDALKQFCELDPKSEAFRYPVTNKGLASTPADLRHINLRILSNVIGRISGFFEGCAMMVLVYIEYKHDMDNEYGSIC